MIHRCIGQRGLGHKLLDQLRTEQEPQQCGGFRWGPCVQIVLLQDPSEDFGGMPKYKPLFTLVDQGNERGNLLAFVVEPGKGVLEVGGRKEEEGS